MRIPDKHQAPKSPVGLINIGHGAHSPRIRGKEIICHSHSISPVPSIPHSFFTPTLRDPLPESKRFPSAVFPLHNVLQLMPRALHKLHLHSLPFRVRRRSIKYRRLLRHLRSHQLVLRTRNDEPTRERRSSATAFNGGPKPACASNLSHRKNKLNWSPASTVSLSLCKQHLKTSLCRLK